MQTNFTLAQLADPDIEVANGILRSCVHCGFCTATCPTYVLLGDELDSPRGRIYLIKDMLEKAKPASEKVVRHVDRCLSCLSCMTTCPSGVHYMHLVDHARRYIEETYKRPFLERLMRQTLAFVLPRPGLFRLALLGSWYGKVTVASFRALTRLLALPFAAPTYKSGNMMLQRVGAMLALTPDKAKSPSPLDKPQVIPPEGARRARVALLTGCAQPVLAPEINEATVRLLTRHGIEVVIAKGAGCCGALTHHMGREEAALTAAKANVNAWSKELQGEGLDAVIINTSGCGTTVKDYGFMLRENPLYKDEAAQISAITRDISEFLLELGLNPPVRDTGLTVVYHAACSLQHGQQVKQAPKDLLNAAGFQVKEPAEDHLCCGSAGTYNLLQPEIAGRLRDRKVAHLESLQPQVIAAGNIGCMTQIAGGTGIPIVHTVELLDWATGGPKPAALES